MIVEHNWRAIRQPKITQLVLLEVDLNLFEEHCVQIDALSISTGLHHVMVAQHIYVSAVPLYCHVVVRNVVEDIKHALTLHNFDNYFLS